MHVPVIVVHGVIPISLALCAAACSTPSSDGSPLDAGTDASATDADTFPTDAAGLTCMQFPQGSHFGWVATFPTFDATCATDADCDFAYDVFNCCGSYRAFGIRRELAANARALGTSCGYGDCGCRPDTYTDDGATMMGVHLGAVGVACVAGQCRTSFLPSVACGTATCAAGQPCVTPCGGAPRCVAVPLECRAAGADCSCFGGIALPCFPSTCVGVGDGGAPVCACGM